MESESLERSEERRMKSWCRTRKKDLEQEMALDVAGNDPASRRRQRSLKNLSPIVRMRGMLVRTSCEWFRGS